MAKQEHVQVKKEAGSLELDTQLQVEQDLNLQVEILEEAISQQQQHQQVKEERKVECKEPWPPIADGSMSRWS